MEKVEIYLIDLTFDKNALVQEAYIELHDNYLRYRAVYDSEVPKDSNDLLQGWEEEFHDIEIRLKRDKIICCDRVLNDRKDFWKIEIEAEGYTEVIRLFFKKDKFEEMQKTYDLLCEYIFKPETDIP